MKNTLKTVGTALRTAACAVVMVLLTFDASAQMRLSETKYDWSGLSNSITQGKTTEYEKFYAIYRWICENISYDTDYKIYSADECYENKRGVCQAYSELFCRLAEAEGLQAVVVPGNARSEYSPKAEGHAWVFAYTNPETGQGILIDPTWGAGSVEHGVFKRNKHDDSWFHVAPEWMIFTHYPEKGSFQLLGDTISVDQFNKLSMFEPFMSQLGFDAKTLLSSELSGQHVEVPKFYKASMDQYGVRRARIPMQKGLRVGEPVQVTFDTDIDPANLRVLGTGRGSQINSGQWVRQGEFVFGSFVPARPGDIKIGVKNSEGSYTTLVEYHVLTPRPEDYNKLESVMPELSPVWEGLSNVYLDVFKEKGVDIAQLLATVKSEGIEKLPILYSQSKYGIQRIPWNETLLVGQTYEFEFLPYEGINCAIIVGDQNKDWLTDWRQDAQTGAWCMTVTPQKRGALSIAIQQEEGAPFNTCIKYTVK